MRIILLFTICLLINSYTFATELDKNILITLPVDSDGVSNLQIEWIDKDLKSFFEKYGESEIVDHFEMKMYYYKTTNYQTVVVGTKDSKTIMYIRLTK